MKRIIIKQGLWFKEKVIVLSFPEQWYIDHCTMAADKWNVLSDNDIKDAIDSPIGCPDLEIIAKNKKEAVILFDDMARPTKPYRIIPYLLQKLNKAGISRKNTRFILASGSHGAFNRTDFVKKLGSNIVTQYPVYNHNCYENCIYAGKTKSGIPLYLNKEFVLCDLKIGIGTVMPHLYCGYSGGGKIVLPGISGINTINAFHSMKNSACGFGRIKNNTRMKTINEAVKLSNLQFKIDFLVNSTGKEVACFTGEPITIFRKAVSTAKKAYSTKHKQGYDVIIANTFTKSNEADIAIHNVIHLLNPKKGIIILVTHNPQSQINHYLFRSFGKFIGGKQYRKRTFLSKNIKYIVFSPYKDYNAFDTFDKPELLIWKKSWVDILKFIGNEFSRPKVAVFSDATIQLLNQ